MTRVTAFVSSCDDAFTVRQSSYLSQALPNVLSTRFHPSVPAVNHAQHFTQHYALPNRSTSSTTALHMIDPFTKSACLSFFDSVKVPSTLVAGISLAALFSLAKDAQDTSFLSKTKIFVMRLYHLSSFLCFIMSLTSIMTAQAATSTLLLESHHWMTQIPSKVIKMEAFLLESMNFELILTRWSFIMSFLLLLSSTGLRMIAEFDLFTRRRKSASIMVISMISAVMTCCISCLNTTQASWPNIWSMTKEVGQVSYLFQYSFPFSFLIILSLSRFCPCF